MLSFKQFITEQDTAFVKRKIKQEKKLSKHEPKRKLTVPNRKYEFSIPSQLYRITGYRGFSPVTDYSGVPTGGIDSGMGGSIGFSPMASTP